VTAALRLAAQVARTRVEGPYLRTAVWVAGCTLGCPGCCNPEMFDPTGGSTVDPEGLVTAMGPDIEGLTILGGEPLEQLDGVTGLAAAAQARGLGVIISTGYTEADARARPGFSGLWPHVDTLIAGPFVASQREPAGGRSMVGSSNQRLLHRSHRYRDPALWLGPRGAEVVLDGRGGATVVGDPALVARVRRRLRPRDPLLASAGAGSMPHPHSAHILRLAGAKTKVRAP